MNTTLRGGIDTYRAFATAAGLTIVLGLAACGGGGGGGNGPGSTAAGPGDRQLPAAERHLQLTRRVGRRRPRQLAVDQIERATDSVGADHRVRIVNEDQGSDTNAAVESAKKFVDTDGASCLTGPWSSEAVAAGRPRRRHPGQGAGDLAGGDGRRRGRAQRPRPDRQHRPARLRRGGRARQGDRAEPGRSRGPHGERRCQHRPECGHHQPGLHPGLAGRRRHGRRPDRARPSRR